MNIAGRQVEERDGDGTSEAMPSSHAVASAERLRQVLRSHEIVADVHNGYGLALVSVWVGLVIWCDGEQFWWRSGWDEPRKRAIYAWHPAMEPDRAANRIKLRYRQLRIAHRLPEVAGDLASTTDGPTSPSGDAR